MEKPNWIAGIVILLLPALFVMKYTAVPYPFYEDDVAIVKLAFQHAGKRIQSSEDIQEIRKRAKKYKEQLRKEKRVRMNLSSGEKVSRERFPVYVQAFIDGEKVLDKEFPAIGLHKDMPSVVYDTFEMKPGLHNIKVIMKDSEKEDAETFLFDKEVEFKKREIKVVTFDSEEGNLEWSENLTPLVERDDKES